MQCSTTVAGDDATSIDAVRRQQSVAGHVGGAHADHGDAHPARVLADELGGIEQAGEHRRRGARLVVVPDGLAFHHRQRGRGADIPETEHPRAGEVLEASHRTLRQGLHLAAAQRVQPHGVRSRLRRPGEPVPGYRDALDRVVHSQTPSPTSTTIATTIIH